MGWEEATEAEATAGCCGEIFLLQGSAKPISETPARKTGLLDKNPGMRALLGYPIELEMDHFGLAVNCSFTGTGGKQRNQSMSCLLQFLSRYPAPDVCKQKGKEGKWQVPERNRNVILWVERDCQT